jgi:hypothetical protein
MSSGIYLSCNKSGNPVSYPFTLYRRDFRYNEFVLIEVAGKPVAVASDELEADGFDV